MNALLEKIYGDSVKQIDFKFPSDAPAYILYGYKADKIIWNDRCCLLIKPKGKMTLPTIRKQVEKIEKIVSMPVVINLDRLSAMQRTSLIKSGTAFVLDSGQMFIPSWGSYFEERIKNTHSEYEKMTANAQLVFLYLIYNNADEMNVKISDIAEALNLPKSTCTRAIQLLNSIGAINIETIGTSKFVTLSGNQSILLNSMKKYMTTPVERTIYVSELPADIRCKIGGIKALSQSTMIATRTTDGAHVLSAEEYRKVPAELILNEADYEEIGGAVVEKWKYDPALLTNKNCVDDISLILSMESIQDERVQGELDKLRKRYGIAEVVEND